MLLVELSPLLWGAACVCSSVSMCSATMVAIDLIGQGTGLLGDVVVDHRVQL